LKILYAGQWHLKTIAKQVGQNRGEIQMPTDAARSRAICPGGVGFETRSRAGDVARAGCKFDTTSLAWGERSPGWQLAWPSNQQAG
jgi:hypothetical protein